jgi:hypothetical protein
LEAVVKRRGSRAFWALTTLALAGHFSTSADDGLFVPGRVVGDLKFLNPSPQALARCAADPVVDPPITASPVELASLLNGSIEAQGSYTSSNTPLGADFKLASFDLNPNVLPSGSNFLI